MNNKIEMRKILNYILILIGFTTYVEKTQAQTSRILFENNFGIPPTDLSNPTDNAGVRKIFSLMGTDHNTFIFADENAPNLKGDANWPEAKHIENNFYAVIGPKYIYKSIPNFDPGYKIWEKLLKIGDNTEGQDGNGGALIVNAGTTSANIIVGESALTSGKYYKLTYDLFVEHELVIINHRIISPSGNSTAALIKSPNFSTAFDKWQKQTYWFFFPEKCSQEKYSIAVQSANGADQGNDFGIDNVKFEEFDTLPENVVIESVVTINCSIEEPTANDDESLENPKGKMVELKIFENDLLTDNSTKPNYSNSTFIPLVPIGASIGIRYNDNNPYVITVKNEGIWTINIENSNFGVVTFKPNSDFNGNPTPIYYKFNQKSNNGTSNEAKITIGYEGNLLAVADYKNGNKNKALTIDVLENDKNSLSNKINKTNVKSITLINPYTLQETTDPTKIEGEGIWEINTTTKELIFTTEENFIGTATSIEYYFTHNNGNKSNKEKVYVTINSSICVKEPNTKAADSFTNVGISTHQTKLENWPTNIPNGFLTLESKNQGFVLTRIERDDLITEPIAGMLIYNTTDQCVKLYNGTEWHCIEKSCNE